jgi:hypothetical protein
MSLRKRIVVLCLIWVVALFPFVLLRRSTWFGRPLSDQQIGEYLHANEKPRQIEHALEQIGQRMSRHDESVAIWYPDLVRLSTHPVEEVRAVDARVMGEAADVSDLRNALRIQLRDGSRPVRLDAALSLARAGDDSGHGEIADALQVPSALTPEQTLQCLAALQKIGNETDLPLISPYELPQPSVSDRVRQQADATANAIRERTASASPE